MDGARRACSRRSTSRELEAVATTFERGGRRGGRASASCTPSRTPRTSGRRGAWLARATARAWPSRSRARSRPRSASTSARRRPSRTPTSSRSPSAISTASEPQLARSRASSANLYLMLSNGGITTLETATRFPIRLVESGPAAGVLAAVFYGDLIGERDLVSFDMGGTTAKMCLIKDGEPAMSSSFEVARVHRFKRGSGLPVQVRSIDLIEIGAGGGSIARVDELGLLKVGPALRGRRSRARLLRPRRHRADGDRRRPGARLPESRQLPRRAHARSTLAGGRGGRRARDRRADGPRRRRRRARHLRGRQREHDRGHAHPRGRARRRCAPRCS